MTQILARQIIEKAIDAGWMICTIESCTGGMVFAALTDIGGSSAVMDRGFVTYSNQAKQEMVGVSGDTPEAFGAVSHKPPQKWHKAALRIAGQKSACPSRHCRTRRGKHGKAC